MNNSPWLRRALIVVPLLALAGFGGAQVYQHFFHVGDAAESDADDESPRSASLLQVEVTRAEKGLLDRTVAQPGTVQAYVSIQIYARVPGYLISETVDIGDRVKKGQTLAKIAVPEIEKQVQKNLAMVELAKAKINQFNAKLKVTEADLEAAKADVFRMEASVKRAQAYLVYREVQLKRMRELFKGDVVEEKLVDEKTKERDAALEDIQTAKAGVLTSKAQVLARAARIQEAQADIDAADADTKVAQAEYERSKVLLDFATLKSPVDGIVTHRAFDPGAFVRAADSSVTPLFNIQQTDKIKVIVQIPDRDVPYADPGDPALVEFDALPGEPIKAKISRIAGSEDLGTRLMHVEVDLPNPTGKIRQGMFGKVLLTLEKSQNWSIPTACLTGGRTENGKGHVFVIQGGVAKKTPVLLGADNGLRVEIINGISGQDIVVVHPSQRLRDGARVTAAAAANRSLALSADRN